MMKSIFIVLLFTAFLTACPSTPVTPTVENDDPLWSSAECRSRLTEVSVKTFEQNNRISELYYTLEMIVTRRGSLEEHEWVEIEDMMGDRDD